MYGFLTLLIRDKKAVTSLEYGLIAALIAGVIIASITSLGTKIAITFTTISTAIH
jgi:pilus assembly protein Flp/PilA